MYPQKGILESTKRSHTFNQKHNKIYKNKADIEVKNNKNKGGGENYSVKKRSLCR